jgi:hypothetical protein
MHATSCPTGYFSPIAAKEDTADVRHTEFEYFGILQILP